MKNKAAVKIICTLLIVVVSLYFLQKLLVPKYVDNVVEGNLIQEYYDDASEHDVVFIGDCEVYENFSPITLWNDYGINSYIRGSAQQLIWQSYYLLEDTLRYEKPEIVIFNVLAMQYNEPQKEAYNRMTLEGMKWSVSKLKAIEASMTKDEKLLDYVFPILRYHSRWSEISTADFQYMFETKKVSHNGYYMRVDVKPAKNVPEGKILANYQFGENAYKYLEKITQLCKENDIQLVLIKAPSLYPHWYDEWEEQIETYAMENELLYINFLELIDETGLDFSQDTYDGGLHLNLSGAEKVTKYLGRTLQEKFVLKDRRDEKELSEVWKKKTKDYELDKKMQYEALEEGAKEN